VTFAPGAAGGAEGVVMFTTSAGSAAGVFVPLIGNGAGCFWAGSGLERDPVQ
jgi:hypothetical protein